MADTIPATDLPSAYSQTTLADTARVPAWALASGLAIAVASIAISLAAALTRGPWIDEFWTLFAIDPAIPLPAVFWQRWITDVHPPLFYFVSRLLANALGGEIPVLRLQNLLGMTALIGFFCYAGQTWDKAGRYLMPCGVMAFSSYFATGYFAEYRSYYFQFVCGICFFSCSYALLQSGKLASVRNRRITAVILGFSCVLLINLHFITALLTEMSLAGLVLTAWGLRKRGLALYLFAVACVSAVPLAAILLFQAPYLLGKAGGNFWIETGFLSALPILAGSFAKGIGLNVAACCIATKAFIARGGTRANHKEGMAPRDAILGMVYVAISAVSVIVLLAINTITPVIIDRYLVLCSAACICGVSILIQHVVFSRRWYFAAILVNAALFLGIAGTKLVEEPRWYATARMIADEVSACPSTVVEALPFPYPGALPNETRVFAMGYDYLARRYGFHVTTPGLQAALVRDATGKCATLVWLEHVPWYSNGSADPDALVTGTAARILGMPTLGKTSVERTKTGAIIIIRPDRRS
jgi:hypothetical protein